jgi:hypothetical protein
MFFYSNEFFTTGDSKMASTGKKNNAKQAMASVPGALTAQNPSPDESKNRFRSICSKSVGSVRRNDVITRWSCMNAILSLWCLVFFLAGCVGQTRPEIPATLPHPENHLARIILTREKQLAGAGSPIIFLDIGKNISPNAMMYIKGVPVEEILNKKNFASTAIGIGFDNLFLWYNPKLVKTLYCGDAGNACIKNHWRWPHKNAGNFLYGTGIIFDGNCRTKLGHCADEAMLNRIMNHQQETIILSKVPNCRFRPSLLQDYNQNIYVAPEFNGYYALTTTPEYVTEIKDIPFAIPDYKQTITTIYEYVPIDDPKLSRNVQVIGSAEVGDTLIWDRKPGIMRLGSAWYDGIGFMHENVTVEAGKSYYVHYTTRMGQRWELTKVE